jgi:choline dehydrogenase-like flavoprotein
MPDYVIAGAGSAGCVLANRLSEDPSVDVLLIEAGGGDRHPNVKIPAAFAKQFRTKRDWNFETEPEPHCDGRSLYMPRGKGLGGSSSMNAMLYVRGHPLDYERWAAGGATGWDWDGIKPYFMRAEDNARGESEHHSIGGPLRVEDERSPRRLTGQFLDSCAAAGIPRIADYNGHEQDGASLAQVTQRNGRRWSTADAYLRPAQGRENLDVISGAQVLGVEMQGTRASGVRYRKGGREHFVRAERETILAAGALASPQLLLLSGIGPADQLRAQGISVIADLPGVGENLQDHPYLTSVWDVPGGGSLADAEGPKALLEYLLRRSGPLTSSVAEAVAFVRSRPGLAQPDLQFHFAPAYFVENGDEEYDGHAITMGPALVGPRSRGWLRLRSADPTDKPYIQTNTLAEPEDVAALIAGTRLTRKIAASEPFASELGRELFPGAGIESDDDLADDLRRRIELLYHPVGTCRMGSDDDAVVDPELRVRGLDGLRVVDASVFPIIPSGNTNAPTIAVAERAADLIAGKPTLRDESATRGPGADK